MICGTNRAFNSMKIIKPYTTVESPIEGENAAEILRHIERCARTCYKSEGCITATSAPDFVRKIVRVKKHESVIEHSSVTVRFIVNRGVSHELVRHRLAAFSQESTRYVSSCAPVKAGVLSDDDIVDLYSQGLSMKRISELSDVPLSEWDVYKALDGEEKRPKGNRGLRDQSAFDAIDTPEKAYLMGIFIADGNMRNDSPQVTVTQHKNISWYLRVMLEKVLRGSVGFGNDRGCHSLHFSGQRLVDALKSKGFVPDKTHLITKDDVGRLSASIPPEFIGDFLRGLLDGDGSIRFFNQSDNPKTGSVQLVFNGQKPVIEWVSEVVNDLVGYNSVVAPVSGSNYLFRCGVYTKAAGVELCRTMYKNFVFPFGNPAKTARVFDEIPDLPWKFAEWGEKKLEVIEPLFWKSPSNPCLWAWMRAMECSERCYTEMRLHGASPQEARDVLPNALKTEVVMTCNMREWRHVFQMRTPENAHPQMQEVMRPLLKHFQTHLEPLFGDIVLKD